MLPQPIVGGREAPVEWSTRIFLLPPLMDGALRSCLPWWTWLVTPHLCGSCLWAEWQACLLSQGNGMCQWQVLSHTSSISRSICTQNYCSVSQVLWKFRISDGFKSCCHWHSWPLSVCLRGAPHIVLCFEERYRQANANCISQVGWQQHPELPDPL